MPTTPAGLRYPTTQDAVCDTDRFIRELAQDIDYRISNGWIATYGGNLTSDQFGETVTAFPQLAAVAGALAFPSTNAVAALWYISGTNVAFRWQYVPLGASGGPQTLANRTFRASVLAWGTPK